jgi:hypothetical protein
MREIRSSGSGEGLGSGNRPAYSTCDQALRVNWDWRMRYLHEILSVVQRVRIPSG